MTGAFLGAGVVALGVSAMPDAKAVDPQALADLNHAAQTSADQAERAAATVPADRGTRSGQTALPDASDAWVLPMSDYTFTQPYGFQFGELHAGVGLAAPEGTPFVAVHAGTVKEAGWLGGYGFGVVLDNGNGIETVYGHARQLLVKPGQKVQAGEMLGLVGSTGHAYGSQLHLETHVNGESRDPIPFLRQLGVDIKLQVASIYS